MDGRKGRPMRRNSSDRRTRIRAARRSVAVVALLALVVVTGCGEPTLQRAHQAPTTDQTGDPKNREIENAILDQEAARAADAQVLPIFMIGDDYRMLEVPANDAQPATAIDNARNVPVAFMIPASADSATGRSECLDRIAVGVLILDDSQPQKIYRLADQSRVKLAGQICRKAFNNYATEVGVKLPESLTLKEGYPAYFSAAYIYRDMDMIEPQPTPTTPATTPKPTAVDNTPAGENAKSATDEALAQARRNVRIIRAADIESFLKENKADVLALMVVQVDEKNQNEQLVALWLWGRDPVTHTLFKPSACVQANKIDLKWPEATDNEQVHMWHSLIDLERRLNDQKTVVIDRPHKTTP